MDFSTSYRLQSIRKTRNIFLQQAGVVVCWSMSMEISGTGTTIKTAPCKQQFLQILMHLMFELAELSSIRKEPCG